MEFRCKRYKEKKLRYFIETTTGRCASCIFVSTKYSLFVSKEEWEKVREEREERELAVARLKV
ncbi:hypothetical protein COCSADRAFT_38214 [Bipolaris sorokiniana ND90Pr]|uniref:Uncharacterized protein n=1 Tax=Cochliobolus sativus (strain ND90Pr / ATCC 201652) TaxID=665912 RepID=M2S7Z0_COCSN|nr:uncharacterized protein COCSADRAFT_38214 [Bipolaris sorokiniana ND90Pr]EMD63363.1 hypothetical protein COCSADRAFT_38214 [Bipolaris sorokiniana ND90Pr]